MKLDSLGDRMKAYESVSSPQLMRRNPVLLRFDACHFHTFTRGFKKPFDDILMITMQETMLDLCKNIQNCVFGYTQSDEITLILVDYKEINTDPWFKNKVQKMCSVGASMVSRYFNQNFIKNVEKAKNDITFKDIDFSKYEKRFYTADFDCRAFGLPKEEVCNCIVWRQNDAERNSIQMLAQSLYPHKELLGLSCNELQNKMFTEKGINWNELSVAKKRGSSCKKDEDGKWYIDYDMLIVKQNRSYIEDLIYFED